MLNGLKAVREGGKMLKQVQHDEKCHPELCKMASRIMQNVTLNYAKCHPELCKMSPWTMQNVIQDYAKCHPGLVSGSQKCRI